MKLKMFFDGIENRIEEEVNRFIEGIDIVNINMFFDKGITVVAIWYKEKKKAAGFVNETLNMFE